MPKGIKNKPEEPVQEKKEEIKEEIKPAAPIATVERPVEPKAIAEPGLPRVEVQVEQPITHLKAYPKIVAGVCEFHGSPYGNVNLQTLTGRCSHFCPNDPLCPHSKDGCPKRIIYKIVDGEPVAESEESGCRHNHNYKGLQIRCSYCPRDADMRAVVKSRTLYVFEHPDKPNVLIMVCNDFRCRQKHLKKYPNSF